MGIYFQTSDQLYRVFGAFFESLRSHPSVAPRVLKLGNNMRFLVADPAAEITIDAKSSGGQVILGPSSIPCQIVLRMSADAGHRFWLGDLSLLHALARRQIVVERGSVTDILNLLPVLKPAHSLYRGVLCEQGFADDG